MLLCPPTRESPNSPRPIACPTAMAFRREHPEPMRRMSRRGIHPQNAHRRRWIGQQPPSPHDGLHARRQPMPSPPCHPQTEPHHACPSADLLPWASASHRLTHSYRPLDSHPSRRPSGRWQPCPALPVAIRPRVHLQPQPPDAPASAHAIADPRPHHLRETRPGGGLLIPATASASSRTPRARAPSCGPAPP